METKARGVNRIKITSTTLLKKWRATATVKRRRRMPASVCSCQVIENCRRPDFWSKMLACGQSNLQNKKNVAIRQAGAYNKSIPVLLDICTDGDLAMLLGGCNVPRWAMHVTKCQYAMHAACQIKKRRRAQLFILFTVFTLPRIVQTFYVFV